MNEFVTDGEWAARFPNRELREEAGCELLGEPVFVGRYVARSRNPTPYRPHLPHPVASWAFYVAPVRIVGEPLNPPGGESVIEVVSLPSDEAEEWLRPHDPTHADVILLAVARGLLS